MPPAGVSVTGFAPLSPQADDPLSDNVFALAMRTGFHGAQAALLRPWLRLSPFQFGRALCRAQPVSQMTQRLALAVPQLCLLSTVRPQMGLKGTDHV